MVRRWPSGIPSARDAHDATDDLEACVAWVGFKSCQPSAISWSAVGTTMLAVRFNRVDAPQSVSLKLKSPAFSMRSGFLYCGTLSSDRENSINRSPANADLSGNLCRSHASVTKRAHLVSLGSGSWRSALVLALGPGFGDANRQPKPKPTRPEAIRQLMEKQLG